MTFDPNVTRNALLDYELAHYRRSDIRVAGSSNALAGVGSLMYLTCVDCCLVGMFDEARELLPKARAFLEMAAATNEREGAVYSQNSLAMCKWLLEGKHCMQDMRAVVEWREAWFMERGHSDKTNVQGCLPGYLDAEEYRILFRRFAEAGLKPPTRLRNIHGQGTMSYVIARHRLGLEYTAEEVASAIDTFLKRRVDSWLSEGHATTVAQWMKIAFWKPGDDPIATLLRSYDYLPGLEPPKYP